MARHLRRTRDQAQTHEAVSAADQREIERFHRTLADGWAYARCYTSEAERRSKLEGWLHYYNYHRPHTACGNQPPFSRLINVPDR